MAADALTIDAPPTETLDQPFEDRVTARFDENNIVSLVSFRDICMSQEMETETLRL